LKEDNQREEGEGRRMKVTVEVGEFYLHELLDRTSVVQELFNTRIAEHPASFLFKDRVEKLSQDLSDLYQAIGEVRFHEEEGK
jgi:hypothetical protein